jgi:hypothetical protein
MKEKYKLSHYGTLSAGRYYELLGKLFKICPKAKRFPLIQHKGGDDYDVEQFSAVLCKVKNLKSGKKLKVLKIYEDEGSLSGKKFNAILLNEVVKYYNE